MSLGLTGQIHVYPKTDQLYDELAKYLMESSIAAADERGEFHLALSGGYTPVPFYKRLVIDPDLRSIPWNVTHVWMVDERCVPLNHSQSNFKMIREILTDHLPTPDHQIHPMQPMSARAAPDYEQLLRRHLNEQGAMDLVLLGMGRDGHTAGLFAHSEALREVDRWVVGNNGPTVVPPPRLTLTYAILNAARHVAVLVTGKEKAFTMHQVRSQLRDSGPDPEVLPITGIQPVEGQISWFLDSAAVQG